MSPWAGTVQGIFTLGRKGDGRAEGKGPPQLHVRQDAQDPLEETAAPAHPGCWDPSLHDVGLTPGAHLCEASLPERPSRTGTSRPWQASPQEVLGEPPLPEAPEDRQQGCGKCVSTGRTTDTLSVGICFHSSFFFFSPDLSICICLCFNI